MKLGLVADLHFGYSHGNKFTQKGINTRESDVYTAGWHAVNNLIEQKVDAIVDLGDMAHTPHPKKRAIMHLINLINHTKVPFYSANGNHTLQRTASDVHLYDVISQFSSNFRGYTKPQYVADLRGLFIPYGTADEVKAALSMLDTVDADFIAGHWACDNVPFPGDHVSVAELRPIPTFLGHYHTRKCDEGLSPLYIGATERFAWGEWKNPTGAAIFDTETHKVSFIEHDTRRWLDIFVNPDTYLGDDHYENIEDAIVRVNIDATAEQYATLDMVSLRKRLAPTLEFQVRRTSKDQQRVEAASPGSVSILDGWNQHIRIAKLPKGVKRTEVHKIGEQAIASKLA